ncbi:TolC family outer membrane protein [Sphingobium subterraneum]|uniref:TolC family outer membrane protein n=1 Tax=Sphingobium subterraneum TaxID=627688 RepID=UPI00160CCB18
MRTSKYTTTGGMTLRTAVRGAAAIIAITLPVAPGLGARSAHVAGPSLDGTPVAAAGSGSPARVTFRDPYADDMPTAYAAPIILMTDAAQNEVAAPAPTPVPPSIESAPTADVVAPTRDAAEPPAGATESLRNAIVASLKGNPDIQIALARQDDARYGVHEAWAGYLPNVSATIATGREYNDPYNRSGTPSNHTTLQRSEGVVTLNQNIWDFGTTINDIKRARAAYRSAQWSTRERIESISFDITAAYLSVLERQKLLDLTRAEIAAHEKILKVVTIQNDLGLITPADISRAKARLENVKAEVLDRQSSLQQAREDYRRLTEHLPATAIDLPSPAAALPPSAEAAVAMIDDHSPRMAQAVEDRRSLERQRASQTGTFFPRVALQAQGNWKNDVQGPTNRNSDARAMVTVTYNFFNGGADIAIRNRISARLREADYELERRRREVEQDIRIDFNALEAARNKIATIDSEIQSAERVVDLYRQQFREGKRSVFDLLDSQQLLFQARQSQLTNGTAKMLSEFRVLQKLGGLFDLVSNGEPLPPLVMPAPGSKN